MLPEEMKAVVGIRSWHFVLKLSKRLKWSFSDGMFKKLFSMVWSNCFWVGARSKLTSYFEILLLYADPGFMDTFLLIRF